MICVRFQTIFFSICKGIVFKSKQSVKLLFKFLEFNHDSFCCRFWCTLMGFAQPSKLSKHFDDHWMIMFWLREKIFLPFCFPDSQLNNHFDVETTFSTESQHFIKILSFRGTTWNITLCLKKSFLFQTFQLFFRLLSTGCDINTHHLYSKRPCCVYLLPEYWYVWLRECKHTKLFYSLGRKTEESLKASCFQDWLCVYVKRRKLSISVVRTREATSLTFHLSF